MIFTLQTPSWADDISDLQIEGMSIGDSLLDHFSKEEIKKANPATAYKDKKYRTLDFSHVKKNLETYERLVASYKTNDLGFLHLKSRIVKDTQAQRIIGKRRGW